MPAIFFGVFSTLSESQTFCATKNCGMQFPIAKLIEKQESYLQLSLLGKQDRYCSLIQGDFAGTQVIDFAGGSGWVYFLIQERFAELDYMVIETREMKEFFEIRHPKSYYTTPSILSSQNRISKTNQILYVNSGVQYPGVLEEMMIIAEHFQIRRIVLDDVPISSTRSFWSCQNYYNFFVPYAFYDLNEIMALMQINGYEMANLSPFPLNSFSSNFEYRLEKSSSDKFESDISQPLSLIFERI